MNYYTKSYLFRRLGICEKSSVTRSKIKAENRKTFKAFLDKKARKR